MVFLNDAQEALERAGDKVVPRNKYELLVHEIQTTPSYADWTTKDVAELLDKVFPGFTSDLG